MHMLAKIPKLQSSLNIYKHLTARCQQMHRIDTNSAMSTVEVNETNRVSSIQPLTMWKKVFNHQKCSSTGISTCWTNIHKLNQWPPKIGQTNVIHKPDTQNNPNLTPRETKSSNWCPYLRHKAAKKAQSDPTEHQMGSKRLPRGRPGRQESAKWPNWSPNGWHVAPKSAPKRPQKTPKMSPSPKKETPWKNLCEIALFSWGNRVFQPKKLKNTSFLPSRGRWFLVLFLKIDKNTSV